MEYTSVTDVIARMRSIDAEVCGADGAGVFNRMYLRVTETVKEHLDSGNHFADNAFLTDLDLRFAQLWFDAYDAPDNPSPAWAPLFDARSKHGVLPIQFALAGMNAHIEHDLPLAVLRTCADRGCTPHSAGIHDDFERVNQVLADIESEVRESFLKDVDDMVDPVAHVVCAWSIDKARDVAWINIETLWELKNCGALFDRYRSMLARTVGMGSRLLLVPVP